MSLVGATVLVVGLSSTLFIAVQATNTSGGVAAHTTAGSELLGDLWSDMQFALDITEQGATAVTFTVPGRSGNAAVPETIRYAWAGAPGDPVTRQYNGGAAATLVDDVHGFGLIYYQPDASVERVLAWIQVSADPRTAIETMIPLLNRP